MYLMDDNVDFLSMMLHVASPCQEAYVAMFLPFEIV